MRKNFIFFICIQAVSCKMGDWQFFDISGNILTQQNEIENALSSGMFYRFKIVNNKLTKGEYYFNNTIAGHLKFNRNGDIIKSEIINNRIIDGKFVTQYTYRKENLTNIKLSLNDVVIEEIFLNYNDLKRIEKVIITNNNIIITSQKKATDSTSNTLSIQYNYDNDQMIKKYKIHEADTELIEVNIFKKNQISPRIKFIDPYTNYDLLFYYQNNYSKEKSIYYLDGKEIPNKEKIIEFFMTKGNMQRNYQ